MDGICGAIVEKMKALGTAGRFFVVSEEEFLEEFPDGAEKSRAALEKALKELKSAGVLDIRYSGGGMYCLALLKIPVLEESKPIPAGGQVKGGLLFLAAFAGGALGGIVTAVTFFLLIC